MLMQGIQRLWISHVDIREDMDTGLGVRIANTPQLVRDFLSRFNQFGFTPGAQQHPGARDGEVSTELEPDSQATAGDDCRLAFVQAG